jgi:hypothetical protein
VKKVLSISVGSSSRDHTTQTQFLGAPFELSRKGTDGDYEKAVRLFAAYDGRVDAFGVGGAEFYLLVGERRYYLRDCQRIRRAIKHSKVGDGNGLKHLLAPRALQALQEYGVELEGKKALQTSAVDRYGMAQALVDFGCDCTFGDLMFALGLPIPIHNLRTVRIIAALILPWLTKLPYTWFYPLGEEQEQEPDAKYPRYYREAEIITGDFLWIRRHMLPDMSGKIIVTNTTTARNVEELQERGVHLLVTTTPRLEGRSFGTNVIEAALRCLVDKRDDQITAEDFMDLIERIPLKPQIEILN